MSERKMTPQERYIKKYRKQFKFDCVTRTEQDIIDKLESVPNKAGYIKSPIRADIGKKNSAPNCTRVYPVLLSHAENGYTVYIPDFNINTQGLDLFDAIAMARDAITLMCADMVSDGKDLPVPSPMNTIKVSANETATLIDVDLSN